MAVLEQTDGALDARDRFSEAMDHAGRDLAQGGELPAALDSVIGVFDAGFRRFGLRGVEPAVVGANPRRKECDAAVEQGISESSGPGIIGTQESSRCVSEAGG